MPAKPAERLAETSSRMSDPAMSALSSVATSSNVDAAIVARLALVEAVGARRSPPSPRARRPPAARSPIAGETSAGPATTLASTKVATPATKSATASRAASSARATRAAGAGPPGRAVPAARAAAPRATVGRSGREPLIGHRDQVVQVGVAARLGAVGDAELAVRVRQVELDRLLGDPQLAGDAAVRVALGGEARGSRARASSGGSPVGGRRPAGAAGPVDDVALRRPRAAACPARPGARPWRGRRRRRPRRPRRATPRPCAASAAAPWPRGACSATSRRRASACSADLHVVDEDDVGLQLERGGPRLLWRPSTKPTTWKPAVWRRASRMAWTTSEWSATIDQALHD